MTQSDLREALEGRQVWIYFAAVIVAGITGVLIPGTAALGAAINPALALMLFVTFLQVPVASLGWALKEVRFLGALLAVNFVVVPLLVAALVHGDVARARLCAHAQSINTRIEELKTGIAKLKGRGAKFVAVNPAKTGYMQRRLINALQDLIVQHILQEYADNPGIVNSGKEFFMGERLPVGGRPDK